MDFSAPSAPIVCGVPGAPGTGAERLREYRCIFGQALVGRERTADGIRFRFRAEPGMEAWVRDLAAREKACYPYFSFSVTARRGEVHWDTSIIDATAARAILDELYALPDTIADGF